MTKKSRGLLLGALLVTVSGAGYALDTAVRIPLSGEQCEMALVDDRLAAEDDPWSAGRYAPVACETAPNSRAGT